MAWVYYLLLDKQELVCGYRRDGGGRREYADLRGDAWQTREIPHTSTVRLADPPIALRYLKGCR